MINTNLLPNLNQAQTMLKALAPHDETFSFQTFADGSEKNKALIKQFNGNFQQHASQLTLLNQQGAGVFVTINKTDGQGRKAQNITGIRAVFVDFDNSRSDRLQDLMSLNKLYDGALIPNMIVESSTGKHHAYWLADGIPLDKFKPYQQTLIYFFKSLFDGDKVDEAIHDLPRIMRLAGFYHNKDEPVLTKIVYPNSGQDIQRYSYEQIKAMIDSLPVPLEKASLLQTKSNGHTRKVILPQSHSKTLPQLTAEKVRTLSRGRWENILGRLGYTVSSNPKEPTQCPVCGGKDRFRFDNENNTGSYICSQGNGKNIAGDGLSLLIDHAGMTPQQSIQAVTGVLNEMGLLSPYDGLHNPLDSEWGELEPLEDTNPTSTRYPIEAWQGVSRQALEAIAYHAQVPLAIAGQCVLGALSTIGQRYINAPMGHEHKPACLFLITEGESGSGKTQANKYSHYSITKWEKKAYQIFVEHLQEWEADRIALKGAERTHYDATVPKPKNESMVITDATIEAVLDRFIVDGLSNQSWTTSEAGQFLNGHSMKSDTAGNALSSLTSIWSGDPVSRLRSQRGKIAIPFTNSYDARITLDIMGQRVILEPALNDPLMNGQGFLPRCLLACPESLIGSRQWATPERMNQSPYDDPRLLAYWARCDILLDPPQTDIKRDITGKEIRFNMPFADQQARQGLAKFQDEIESRQAKGNSLEYLRAFASRMAENASRIASLMAFFDCQKSVSLDYLERAFMLVEYSIAERLRYLDAKPVEKTDSQKLIDWIIKQCKVKGVNCLSYADTQSKVNPKQLRAKAIFELCVNVLSDKKYIKVITLDNTRYIKINPSLLK